MAQLDKTHQNDPFWPLKKVPFASWKVAFLVAFYTWNNWLNFANNYFQKPSKNAGNALLRKKTFDAKVFQWSRRDSNPRPNMV